MLTDATLEEWSKWLGVLFKAKRYTLTVTTQLVPSVEAEN
jgi:hypothetical protein